MNNILVVETECVFLSKSLYLNCSLIITLIISNQWESIKSNLCVTPLHEDGRCSKNMDSVDRRWERVILQTSSDVPEEFQVVCGVFQKQKSGSDKELLPQQFEKAV